MPQSKAEVMINLGVPAQLATELQNQIENGTLQIGTTSTTAMAGNRTPTSTIRGGVLQQAQFPDIGAAPTQANFNALLAALRSAGVIAP